jgi:hypothetical protein
LPRPLAAGAWTGASPALADAVDGWWGARPALRHTCDELERLRALAARSGDELARNVSDHSIALAGTVLEELRRESTEGDGTFAAGDGTFDPGPDGADAGRMNVFDERKSSP